MADLGNYHKTILEKDFEESKQLYNNERLSEIDTQKGIYLLGMEVTGTAGMGAGGGLSFWDALAVLINQCSLKLGTEFIFEKFTGAKLLDNIRTLPPEDMEFWPVEDLAPAPGATESGSFHLIFPLLYRDAKYRGGKKYHRWPSELIQQLKFSLVTGALADVPNLESFTAKIRIRAYGIEATKMVCAPIPHFRYEESVDSKYDLLDGLGAPRAIAAVSTTQFADNLTEKDKITIDGQPYFAIDTTVGDMLDAQDASRRARGGLTALRSSMLTNAISSRGVDDYMHYLSPFGDLGDHPFRGGVDVQLTPGSSRNLHFVEYKRWTRSQIGKIARAIGVPDSGVETLAADGVSLEALGNNEVVTLPVSFGEYQ